MQESPLTGVQEGAITGTLTGVAGTTYRECTTCTAFVPASLPPPPHRRRLAVAALPADAAFLITAATI
jgi:hypothetical protein